MAYFRKVRGQLEEVPGAKKVDIKNFESFEFFAARLDDPAVNPDKEYKNTPKGWCVYSVNGKSLWWDDTKEKAIEGAGYRLNGIDREVVESLLSGVAV